MRRTAAPSATSRLWTAVHACRPVPSGLLRRSRAPARRTLFSSSSSPVSSRWTAAAPSRVMFRSSVAWTRTSGPLGRGGAQWHARAYGIHLQPAAVARVRRCTRAKARARAQDWAFDTVPVIDHASPACICSDGAGDVLQGPLQHSGRVFERHPGRDQGCILQGRLISPCECGRCLTSACVGGRRQKAKLYHPDMNKENPSAQKQFVEATRAYEVQSTLMHTAIAMIDSESPNV